MEAAGYLAIICIGILLGCMGAGGSMLAIPVFVYLFSLDMVIASAYSLFVVGVTSLTGVVLKQKLHMPDLRAGLTFGIPSVISTFVARKWIVLMIPELIWQTGSFRLEKGDVLLYFFSLMMITSSLITMRKRRGNVAASPNRKMYLITGGLLVGTVAGMVGAGGGFLILPVLLVSGLQISTAVTTTLLIIASNSLLGFCGDVLNQRIDWFFLLPLTALAVLGLVFGHWWNKKYISAHSWQKAFSWCMLTGGLGMLIKEFVIQG